MCGIVGYVRDTPIDSAARWSSERSLEQACRMLSHRGPDGHGIWQSVSGQVGLGHRRLTVNGGAEAIQPIENEDGSIVAVVNGEFYDGGDAIRSTLIRRGHQFRTEGDSELALHLYEEHGLGFVEHLRGEFAILIWDSRCQRLVAVRDRFGIKPLVYTRFDGQWWFASQVRALAAAGVVTRPDQESVWHAMSFQYTLPERTLSEGVMQLPPGHLGICSGDCFRIHRYWDMDYPVTGEPPCEDSDPLTMDAFGELFDESVRLRLRGDVPVAAHLSGGIDSAAVLESAMRQGGVAKAFTVGFHHVPGYDEVELAKEVAAWLDVGWQEIAGDPAKLVDALPAALDASEGWCVNGHLPAKYLLNLAIHQAGYKVSLTGEGGDELLAGYPHLRLDHYRACGNQVDADGVLSANAASRGIMLPQGNGLDVIAVVGRLGFVPAFMEAKASLGQLLQSHLRQDFLDQFSDRDPYQEWLDSVAPAGQLRGRQRVHQSLYLWNKTALPQYILKTLGDGCESAHSVEGRLPMLDHHLFDWVKNLPLEWLFGKPDATIASPRATGAVRPPAEKRILRRFAANRVPDSVVAKSKHPFVAPPLSDVLDSESMVREQLQSAIDEHPWFEPAKLRATLATISLQPRSVQIATDPLWWTVLSSSRMASTATSRDAFAEVRP